MKFVLLYLLRAYKMLISPLLPPACRFTPTCSRVRNGSDNEVRRIAGHVHGNQAAAAGVTHFIPAAMTP